MKSRFLRTASRFIVFILLSSVIFYQNQANALPINLSLTINRVESEDTDPPFNDNDLFALVDIDNTGFQQQGPISGQNTINPNWVFVQTIDPRFRTTYNVPITMEIWDEDVAFNDQIDVSPFGKDINLSYNLQTRGFTGDVNSSPSSGSDSPKGTVFFDIISDPFQYLFNVQSTVTILGPSLFQYDYTLFNLTNSTFDIGHWLVGDIRILIPAVQPGLSTSFGFKSRLFPTFETSVVGYNDLDGTTLSQQIQYPVPEPTTIALFGIGIVGLAGAEVRRRRKKKAVEKAR